MLDYQNHLYLLQATNISDLVVLTPDRGDIPLFGRMHELVLADHYVQFSTAFVEMDSSAQLWTDAARAHFDCCVSSKHADDSRGPKSPDLQAEAASCCRCMTISYIPGIPYQDEGSTGFYLLPAR